MILSVKIRVICIIRVLLSLPLQIINVRVDPALVLNQVQRGMIVSLRM